jgi:hypothetical protein
MPVCGRYMAVSVVVGRGTAVGALTLPARIPTQAEHRFQDAGRARSAEGRMLLLRVGGTGRLERSSPT